VNLVTIHILHTTQYVALVIEIWLVVKC